MPSTDASKRGGQGRLTAEAVMAAFEGNYREAQYHFVQCLSEHLIDCNRVFGGDFGQVVILATIGQRFLQARLEAPAASARVDDKIWMSTVRLADVTGLPRESVRRKLRLMEARGWVRQERGKGWTLAGSLDHPNARKDLEDLDHRGMQRLAKLTSKLQAVIQV